MIPSSEVLRLPRACSKILKFPIATLAAYHGDRLSCLVNPAAAANLASTYFSMSSRDRRLPRAYSQSRCDFMKEECRIAMMIVGAMSRYVLRIEWVDVEFDEVCEGCCDFSCDFFSLREDLHQHRER